MRKIWLSFIWFLLGFGVVFAYTQAGNTLINANNLSSAFSDNTLIATNASGCNASGTVVPSAGYIKSCVKNSGNCFPSTPNTYVPTYSAILACKATSSPTATPGPTPTPVPTATPTPAPTATPVPHTTGLAITDGCITSTSDYQELAGSSITPVYQAVGTPSGSQCSSGNQLYNGSISQVLNHGAVINAGTIVRVGADLYGNSVSGTYGSADCEQTTGTANAKATIEIINSAGTVIGSNTVTGNASWAYETYTVSSIPATGVYYIAAVSTTESATVKYEVDLYKANVREGCQAESTTLTAYGYITYLTVASS